MKKEKKKIYFSIHYSFFILLFLGFISGVGWLLISYFIFLVLHEFVHSVVAKKLGYKIGKIKLLATGAMLEAESDEFSFSDEIKISISAPIFNLLISIFILGLWWINPESYNYSQDLFVINLAIFCFNMLPIFPLDGGRILLAYLSKNMERKKAVSITRAIAIFFSCGMFLLFIFSLFSDPNFSIGIMAITLFVGGISEDKSAVYKKVFYITRKKQRTFKSGVETRYVMVNKNMEKAKLLKLINARFYTVFLFVDDNLNVVKEVGEAELL